jgi:S1-C subfamily serine protease
MKRQIKRNCRFCSRIKSSNTAVVHIKTLLKSATELILENLIARKQRSCNGFRFWYLITRMYIATNNHVIENASDIKVILPDKREFSAELIGRDEYRSSTFKNKSRRTSNCKMGNSDNVQIGEWVLLWLSFLTKYDRYCRDHKCSEEASE